MHACDDFDRGGFCAFLPPYLIRRLAENDSAAVRRLGLDTIEAGAVARTRRSMQSAPLQGRSPTPGLGRRRTVYDMEGSRTPLPGSLRREENQAATGLGDVDMAYDHAGTTHAFYKAVLRRESLDGAGYPLTSSVNYGTQVANAFWEGTQIVYGAGDGDLFLPFTRSLVIAAHEMSHGVISFTSNLAYRGQPGALNESFCDVMGISVSHHASRSTADTGSWFVGAEVVGPGLAGVRGFRSFLAEPAYVDHAILGTDPQPKHMKDFVVTTDDDGGVHINSGIPNYAFHLAAVSIGGNIWDGATRIWYETFTQELNPQATFEQAAQTTEMVARRLFGRAEGDATADAWRSVGL